MTMAFDTHAFVKDLKAAGFDDAQAEALTDGLRRLREVDAAAGVTRGDLISTEDRINLKLAEIKADLLKWMFGTIAVQTLAIIGAIAALPRAGG